MGQHPYTGEQCGADGSRRHEQGIIRRGAAEDLGGYAAQNPGRGHPDDPVRAAPATEKRLGTGPYATAKAGLHGLSSTLAVELGPANILSNIVMPGALMTERTQANITAEQRKQIEQSMPTRQLITPEDVAALIVFLGSPVNRQITGETIRITGGR
jgi:NAD(P)-dependent dehydrogenase (short-subunit alcohol dehydrogenase family)